VSYLKIPIISIKKITLVAPVEESIVEEQQPEVRFGGNPFTIVQMIFCPSISKVPRRSRTLHLGSHWTPASHSRQQPLKILNMLAKRLVQKRVLVCLHCFPPIPKMLATALEYIFVITGRVHEPCGK
jgi:hypothetical protein